MAIILFASKSRSILFVREEEDRLTSLTSQLRKREGMGACMYFTFYGLPVRIELQNDSFLGEGDWERMTTIYINAVSRQLNF